MTPEQELSYYKMVDHINNNRLDDAREIVGDQIAQKVAERLAEVNSQKQEANQERFWTDKQAATASNTDDN